LETVVVGTTALELRVNRDAGGVIPRTTGDETIKYIGSETA